MVSISMHFHREVPKMVIDEITVEDREIHIVRFHSLEDDCEIEMFFHDQQLFDEFIAQLKSQTWWR
jgi:hypothetical protein